MSDAFKDQLLKLGVVTQQQIDAVEKNRGGKSHKPNKPHNSRPPAPSSHKNHSQPSVAKPAQQAIAVADDAKKRKEEKERQRALRGQLRDLLNGARVNLKDAELIYRFVVGTHVKQLHVNEAQRDQLQRGELAIVLFDGRCQLIGLDTAQKVRELLPVIPVYIATEAANNASDASIDPEYADYQVPDDFTW